MQRDPEKDFPILKKHSIIILKFAKNFIANGFKYKEDDHFAFMILCFLTKQIEHFHSLMVLIDARQYSDSTVLARVMIEGMATISWVSIAPTERAFKWRNFCVVTDYRTLLEKKKKGEKYTKEERSVLERIKNEGDTYLKNKHKNYSDFKKLPEDPYKYRWQLDENDEDIVMAALFKASQGEKMYSLYRSISDWIHWNVPKIGLMIKRKNGRIQIAANPIVEATTAMAAGIASLHYLLYVANEYLKMNSQNELKSIEKNYLLDLGIR
ncbi:MAG: DUF5677 domain-containing protein [Candidatus Lokiarchaeota archaeon]|nr:DUF5677 domain-containing protein [Candidatus Lokiarchaeota archaeon]